MKIIDITNATAYSSKALLDFFAVLLTSSNIVPLLMSSINIQKHYLVSTLFLIFHRILHWISHFFDSYKVYSLYYLTVTYVKTWYYSFVFIYFYSPLHRQPLLLMKAFLIYRLHRLRRKGPSLLNLEYLLMYESLHLQ